MSSDDPSAALVTPSPESPTPQSPSPMAEALQPVQAPDRLIWQPTAVRPLSAAMSAAAADEHDVLPFPPRRLVDFVVHYADTDFHVHKFVLYHHSNYFKVYFDTLTLTLPSDVSASPSSASDASRCSRHPHIADCIHLPQQARLVELTVVTAADFRLFLCHLYFSAHYCYPPYLPKGDVDLDSAPAVCLTFPAVTSLTWGATCPLRCSDAEEKFLVSNEALLTLAHYLDCQAMVAQCEAVMTTQMASSVGAKSYSTWLTTQCVAWLQWTERYKLQQWKKACLTVIAAADKSVLESEGYMRAKQMWDKALVVEVMEAMLKSKG